MKHALLAAVFGSFGLFATLMLSVPADALQAPPAGETLFRQHCAACHSMVAGQPSRLAPNLAGISGRRAGSASFAYSPALRASGLTWDRATLDRYLAAPTSAVPGTRMVVRVTDARRRAVLIDYLLRR